MDTTTEGEHVGRRERTAARTLIVHPGVTPTLQSKPLNYWEDDRPLCPRLNPKPEPRPTAHFNPRLRTETATVQISQIAPVYQDTSTSTDIDRPGHRRTLDAVKDGLPGAVVPHQVSSVVPSLISNAQQSGELLDVSFTGMLTGSERPFPL